MNKSLIEVRDKSVRNCCLEIDFHSKVIIEWKNRSHSCGSVSRSTAVSVRTVSRVRVINSFVCFGHSLCLWLWFTSPLYLRSAIVCQQIHKYIPKWTGNHLMCNNCVQSRGPELSSECLSYRECRPNCLIEKSFGTKRVVFSQKNNNPREWGISDQWRARAVHRWVWVPVLYHRRSGLWSHSGSRIA